MNFENINEAWVFIIAIGALVGAAFLAPKRDNEDYPYDDEG